MKIRGYLYRFFVFAILFLFVGALVFAPLSQTNMESWILYLLIGIYCGLFVLVYGGNELYIYLKNKKGQDHK